MMSTEGATTKLLPSSCFWAEPDTQAKPVLDQTSSEDDASVQVASKSAKKKRKRGQKSKKRQESSEEEQEDDSDDEDISQGIQNKRKKRSRQEKERQAEEREKHLRAAERSRLDKTATPSSEREFRELLQANPLCSISWIKFIAYFVSMSEVDKARDAAREALNSLPLESQQERLQVWSVWLRVEVHSKAEPATIDRLLREAAGNVDDYKLLSNMATIYHEAGEGGLCPKAEALLKRLTKKYYAEGGAWEQLGRYYYSCGCFKEARNTLARAAQVLKRKPAVEVTKKFAIYEFQFGESDHGCKNFEILLNSCNHRLDVWNVYVDQLIKYELHEKARTELRKMCKSTKNLKTLNGIFKKTRAFEEKHFPKTWVKTQLELAKIMESLDTTD